MRDAVLVSAEELDAIVDRGRAVAVRRELWRLDDVDKPPLAVERTRASDSSGGPIVVLVHGLAQNRFTWRLSGRSMVAWLAERGFEVLNLELRGHGLSRELGARNARGIADYVDDLVRVVARCDAPPFVIGHSLGGAVCLGASTRAPLAGLVHLGGLYSFASSNRTLRALARLSLAFQGTLTLSPVRMRTGWAGDLLGQLYQVTEFAGFGFPIAGWVPHSIERDLLRERLSLGFDWESVEVWLEMSRWAADGRPGDVLARFGEVDVPLLVVSGDHDALSRPEDGRRCFEASGSRDKTRVVLEPFDHQVHWGHVDMILGRHAPAVVWPIIGQWMTQRTPAAGPRSSR